MNKHALIVLCCAVLLAALTFSISAQEDNCQTNTDQLQTLLSNLLSAKSTINQSDSAGALAYLTEAQILVENLISACGGAGGMNWCNPGQPWGDGRCNGPNLTQEQIDWFWACGTYWAEYEAGLLANVPDWCGCNTDVDDDCDGIPNDADQCAGAADDDSDGDGVIDCKEQCPNDPNKTAPGICGCGVSDTTDSDGDGVVDCVDACPMPDDDWQVGEFCWSGSTCFVATRVDYGGDGCSIHREFWTTTGCDASTPPCP